jgi:hypothetical protein
MSKSEPPDFPPKNLFLFQPFSILVNGNSILWDTQTKYPRAILNSSHTLQSLYHEILLALPSKYSQFPSFAVTPLPRTPMLYPWLGLPHLLLRPYSGFLTEASASYSMPLWNKAEELWNMPLLGLKPYTFPFHLGNTRVLSGALKPWWPSVHGFSNLTCHSPEASHLPPADPPSSFPLRVFALALPLPPTFSLHSHGTISLLQAFLTDTVSAEPTLAIKVQITTHLPHPLSNPAQDVLW